MEKDLDYLLKSVARDPTNSEAANNLIRKLETYTAIVSSPIGRLCYVNTQSPARHYIAKVIGITPIIHLTRCQDDKKMCPYVIQSKKDWQKLNYDIAGEYHLTGRVASIWSLEQYVADKGVDKFVTNATLTPVFSTPELEREVLIELAASQQRKRP